MFVPEGFDPPTELVVTTAHGRFRLEPLGPEHNERDHAAWTTSMDHIRATPGFPDGRWPRPMSAAENAEDLARHARDFAARRGFTYTVLDEHDDVVGCVYVYPAETRAPMHAHATSWVRADVAELDPDLRAAVRDWLHGDAWPFDAVDYPGADGG